MAILTKENLMELVKGRIGEDTSDEALKFIEDITDTITDFESKASGQTEWENKYNDLASKYKERFFSSEDNPKPPKDEPVTEPKKYTYDSLFKEGE